MPDKIKIGISSCLLGNNVRYNGEDKQDHYLTGTLGQYIEWVPVCPEVEYGLPVPREPMRLTGDPGSPRIVTINTGIDHTDGMLKWARSRLKKLDKENICGFIFKSRSPSSGYKGVRVHTSSGIRMGSGIFAAAFMKHFPLLPVEDEEGLKDPVIMENFLGQILVVKCWEKFLAEKK